MNDARKDIPELLESIIDRSSVHAVLEAIAEVCRLKAVHLRDNWQDMPGAKAWLQDAKVVERTVAALEKIANR